MDRRHNRQGRARPLVLLIEAHEDTRALYALALSASGFDVDMLDDGGEPYRRACDVHPDIIVTDLPMPNFDGWQFLLDLKQDPATCNIPVVAVSGYIQRSMRERAERHGFAGFFTKPCLPGELVAGLRLVLHGNIDGG